MGVFVREENYFGIDIGTTSIRVVQLRKMGSKPTLVAYGDVEVPPGLTTSDSQIDRDKIAGIIRELLKDTRITSKNVVAGLPSSQVYASVIDTPKLSPADLAKAIKFQADQYIPMAIDQVKMDWSVIGPSKDEKNQEVLLIAAPNMVTQKYLDIFEKAGLEILALEANSTALARAVVPPESAPVMLLDISSATSDLAIIYHNAPRLIRNIPVGGNMFIKSVAQGLGLDDAQAQQFTYRFGLTQTKLEGQVLKAIKPSLDNLVTELEKSAKFFYGRYPDVKLEKLVLTGGTSQLPELPTYLANAMGMPVEISNAWINVAYPASLHEKLLSSSNQFGVAVGLAERNFV